MYVGLSCDCGGGCQPSKRLGLLSAAVTVATSPAATPAATTTAVSPTTIIAQVCPSGVGKGNCPTKNVSDFTGFLQSAITSRFLPPYTTATGASSANACAGIPTTSSAVADTKLATTAAGTGVAVAGSIATAIGVGTAALPVIGTIIGLVGGIISAIVGHHASAVKEQDSILCQAVPAVNNMLAQMDAGLAGGTITPSQASSSYASFLSQFSSEMQSDPSYNSGDAMGGYLVALQCVIAARNQDLQNGMLTSGAVGPWVQSSSSAAGDSSLSSVESVVTNYWPWLVAAGLGVWLLM